MSWFSIGFITSSTTLLAFATWALIDASFPVALDVALIDLRLRSHPGIDMVSEHGWAGLGPRLIVFALLSVIALVSAISVVIGLLFVTPPRGSIGAWLLSAALICAWLCIIVRMDDLIHFGFEMRIRSRLGAYQSLASQFTIHWPRSDVMVNPYGLFRVDDGHTWLLKPPSSKSKYPLRDAFGPFIRRNDDGAILFDLDFGYGVRLEFHATNSVPKSFTDSFDGLAIVHQLVRTKQLDNGTYLSWYSATRKSSLEGL